MAGTGTIDLLESLSTTHYALLAAALLGLLGFCWFLYRSSSSAGSTSEVEGGRNSAKEGDKEENESSVEKESASQRGKRQQPKARVPMRAKPSRKISLPSHPLLAAEFKGHTGPVLSVDFDSSGKYFASCSEGQSAATEVDCIIPGDICTLCSLPPQTAPSACG